MKIRLQDLTHRSIDKLIIHSLEQALYQASVVIRGEEHLVWETDKKPLRSRNIVQLQQQFGLLNIPHTVLRQESPYDEMIGLPAKTQTNALEVPLAIPLYASTE